MRLVSACSCWRDAFFFVSEQLLRGNCVHESFTPQFQNQAAGRGGGRNMCLLCQLCAKEFEDRPSTSLQTKHHGPEVDQSNCTSPGPTEFAHFKISGNIMPIVIFGHMAPSSCVRTKLTRPVHSAHEDPNGERSKSAFVDLRHRRRNVCKWTVVRVEKQATRCRQIGSFPWWRWQTILKTARLWTPVTLPFLDGLS